MPNSCVALAIQPLLLLCAAYVVGCSFRSVLPRADVQRICLVDTWLSSVMVGRFIATVAELCFVIQWAIVLRALGSFGLVKTSLPRFIVRQPLRKVTRLPLPVTIRS